MVENTSNLENVCKAHSGVLMQIKIGGGIIAALMALFSAILGFMWSDQKDSARALASKIEVSTITREIDLKGLKDKVDEIWKEQMRIKWVLEEKDKIIKR